MDQVSYIEYILSKRLNNINLFTSFMILLSYILVNNCKSYFLILTAYYLSLNLLIIS